MRHNFGDFLRHGGNGQYLIAERKGRVYGYRADVSIKSAFPNYAALRADFTDRLDKVAADNTRMLLNALTPPDTVPIVTEADLREVTDAKEESLSNWDARLEGIFSAYQTHPQRLHPVRTNMEERLLRGFAGLVNQLRQEDLGIEQYVWRSRDDAKVRDSHADYDDQVFQWGDPPVGGHPGQAHNCRCVAEPILPAPQSNVALADFASTADSFPIGNGAVRRLANGLLARSPAGLAAYAALEASNQLQSFTDAANEQRIQDAAEIMGADLSTVEGILTARAYAMAKELAENGFLSNTPERGDRARIIAEAIGLYEMYQPGLFTLPSDNSLEAVGIARRLAEQALAALEAERLSVAEGELAQGWVEIFPELTEDERRLGELPGFTPERIDEWLETYPAEDLGLPNHTGSPLPDDPTGNIISTPIPEETGANIVATERTPEELGALASDPAHGGATTPGAEREREIGLGAEQAGIVKGPIIRDPSGAAEFIDSDGQAWDVKGFRSDFPVSRGGFEIDRAMNNVEKELRSGHNVIIDTGNLSEDDLGALQTEIERRGFSERVVYWP